MKTSQLDMNQFANPETYAVIQDVSLMSCTLNDKIFSGSLLKNNSFTNVIFEGCVFFASDLERVQFIGCEFRNCQFQYVNSRSCDFTGCKFTNSLWVHGSTLYNHLSNCEMDMSTIDQFEKGNNKLLNCFVKELPIFN